MSLPRDDKAAPKHPLIIVCCHAIYLGKPPSHSSASSGYDVPHDPYKEENWLLKPFQRGNSKTGKEGEHSVFIAHIQRAVNVANAFKSSPSPPASAPVICFSGGRTHEVTTLSEAEGYLHVYESFYAKTARKVLVEDMATDSFQNVLFSLVRYRQAMGRWPDHITVVTHKFKRRRIAELHLKALRWPAGAAEVDGVDPEFSDDERAAVEAAESRCCDEWEKDLYGCRPPLSSKRKERLWDEKLSEKLSSDCEDLKDLLLWDGGEDPRAVFGGKLPWGDAS